MKTDTVYIIKSNKKTLIIIIITTIIITNQLTWKVAKDLFE